MLRSWSTISSLHRLRRIATVGLLAAAVLSGSAIMDARAADQRLDEALLFLQKGQALLMAAQTGGGFPKKVEHQFQRHVNRAIALIDRVTDQIEAAKDVVDNP